MSLFLDACALFAAFLTALGLRVFHSQIPLLSYIPAVDWPAEQVTRAEYTVLLLVSMAVSLGSTRLSGLYRTPGAERFAPAATVYLRSLGWAALAVAFATFALQLWTISRVFFVYYFLLGLLFLCTKQAAVVWLLGHARRDGVQERVLVIGRGDALVWLVAKLSETELPGMSLVGCLVPVEADIIDLPGVASLGTLDTLDEVLRDHPVDSVFLVGSAKDLAATAGIAEDLIRKGRVVSLVAPLTGGAQGIGGRVNEVAGVPMLSFGPRAHHEVGSAAKRSLDVAVSALLLVALAPLLAAVAFVVRAIDGGPALFRQRRLGRGGGQFELYKFRSMRVDAEGALREDEDLYRRYVANDFKLEEHEDPRITRFGRFLRRSSLDELPQLWNVLRGDMSLVGPRPIVPAEVEKYEPYAEILLSVRPGLTGHWQVSGRSDVPYPARAFMDFDYISDNSIASDLSILFRTVPAILRRRGAH